MESVITGLQSSDINTKCSSAEKCSEWISGKRGLGSLQSDQKLRLIRGVLSNVKEANFRVVVASLVSLELLLQHCVDTMAPHLNIAFDHTMVKLGDAKVNVRTKAFDVMVLVLARIGPCAGTEKLFPHFTHKNVVVRERISQLVVELLDYQRQLQEAKDGQIQTQGPNIVDSPNLLTNIAVLLQDSAAPVRQAAIELVVQLHETALSLQPPSLSASAATFCSLVLMLRDLESAGVRPQLLRSITDAVQANAANRKKKGAGGSGEASKKRLILAPSSASNALSSTGGGASSMKTVAEFRSLLNSTGAAKTAATEPPVADVKAATMATSSSRRGGGSASAGSGVSKRTTSATPAVQLSESFLLSSKDPVCSMFGLVPLTSTAGAVGDTAAAVVAANDDIMEQNASCLGLSSANDALLTGSCFHPAYYLSLLATEAPTSGSPPPPKPYRLYSDKDLGPVFDRISGGIGNMDDWLARMQALSLIQGLVLGDAMEYVGQFVAFIKSIHEPLSSTVTDLRSSLSKEGCRTLALMAKTLGTHFNPVAELFICTLLKQVGAVSTAVMSSAAQKSILVVISCTEWGFPKAMGSIIDACTSKSPALRQHALDYSTLAVTLWTSEAMDKYLPGLKNVVDTSVADKSPDVRKSARRLFWAMYSRSSDGNTPNLTWRDASQVALRNMDASARKSIISELVACTGGGRANMTSPEIAILLMKLRPDNISTPEGVGDGGSQPSTPHGGGARANGFAASGAHGAADTAASLGSKLGSTGGPPRLPKGTASTTSVAQQKQAKASLLEGTGGVASSDDLSDIDDGNFALPVTAPGPLKASKTAKTAVKAVNGDSSLYPPEEDVPRSAMERGNGEKKAKVDPVDAIGESGATVGGKKSSLTAGPVRLFKGKASSGTAHAGDISGKAGELGSNGPVASAAPLRMMTVGAKQQASAPKLTSKSDLDVNSASQSIELSGESTFQRPQSDFAPEPSSEAAADGIMNRMSVSDFMKSLEKSTSRSSSVASSVDGNITAAAPATSSTSAPKAGVAAGSSILGTSGARRMKIPPSGSSNSGSAQNSTASKLAGSSHAANKRPASGHETANTRLEATSKAGQASASHKQAHTEPAVPEPVEEVAMQKPRAVADMSNEEIKRRLADTHWDVRVDAMESIAVKVGNLIEAGCASAEHGEFGEETTASSGVGTAGVWQLAELCCLGLSDAHHRVTQEALSTLSLFLDQFNVLVPSVATAVGQMVRFLSSCLPELFQRLLDQHKNIRTQANTLLNSIRMTFEPGVILTALSPRVSDVPDKVKTAVMQFLQVIVPYGFDYFSVASNTSSFLSRMAVILSNRPSNTLQQAGIRLLELVYNVSPGVICTQIALLPLQQQLLMKKAFSAAVPEIDSLVLSAGRAANSAATAALSASTVELGGEKPSTATVIPGKGDNTGPVTRTRKDANHSASGTRGAKLAAKGSVVGSRTKKPEIPTFGAKSNAVLRAAPGKLNPAQAEKTTLKSTFVSNSLYEEDEDENDGQEQAEIGDNSLKSDTVDEVEGETSSVEGGGEEDQELEDDCDMGHERPLVDVGGTGDYSNRGLGTSMTPSPIQVLSGSSSGTSFGSSTTLSRRELEGSAQRVLMSTDDSDVLGRSQLGNSGGSGRPSTAGSQRTPLGTTAGSLRELYESGGDTDGAHSTSRTSAEKAAFATTAFSPQGRSTSVSATPKNSGAPDRGEGVVVNKGEFALMPEMRKSPAEQASPQLYHSPIELAHSAYDSAAPASGTKNNGARSNSSGPFSTPTNTHNSTSSGSHSSGSGAVPEATRDLSWLILSLQRSTSASRKLEAVRELKSLATGGSANNGFWSNNCGQILSVLLEAFSPDVQQTNTGFAPDANAVTGLSPFAPSGATSHAVHAKSVSKLSGIVSSPTPAPQTPGKPGGSMGQKDAGINEEQKRNIESMHISCKALSILIKYRSSNVKSFMELLVNRLCQVAAFAPMAITFQCEQLLTAVAGLDPPRFVGIVLPYTKEVSDSARDNGRGDCIPMRLLALTVLPPALKHFTSPLLLSSPPNAAASPRSSSFIVDITSAVLPSLHSDMVDMRKGVVTILVELYAVVGEALYPYVVDSMTQPQKKLLAIYIQRYNATKKANSGQ